MATIEILDNDQFDIYEAGNLAQFRDGRGRAPGAGWYSDIRMRRGVATISHQEAARLLRLAGHNVVFGPITEGESKPGPQSVGLLMEELEKLREQVKDLTEQLQQARDRANNWYTQDGVVKLTEQEVIDRRKHAAFEMALLRDQVKDLTEELQQERDRANKAAEYAAGCDKVMKLACGVAWLVERVKADPQSVRERGDALQLDAMMRALKADEYGAAEMERITKRGAPAWPLKES